MFNDCSFSIKEKNHSTLKLVISLFLYFSCLIFMYIYKYINNLTY